MSKSMKIIGIVLATTGLAYAIKHTREKKKQRSDWHKIKVEEERRTGSRYGSNPVKY